MYTLPSLSNRFVPSARSITQGRLVVTPALLLGERVPQMAVVGGRELGGGSHRQTLTCGAVGTRTGSRPAVAPYGPIPPPSSHACPRRDRGRMVLAIVAAAIVIDCRAVASERAQARAARVDVPG